MGNRIEQLKAQLNEAKDTQGDWQTPYYELIKEVYNQPVLFFALSREAFNPEDGTSIPLISTKDFNGTPALYVFTDVNIATLWMRHYKHTTDDMKYGLIAAIEKGKFDFLSAFVLARNFGTQLIMLDEGASFVAIRMQEFMEQNNIDPNNIQMPISKEQYEKIIAENESIKPEFVRVKAIPLAFDK